MKASTLRIRLDEDLARLLDQAARKTGRSLSEIARDPLCRHLRLARFDAIRRRILPLAEARGFPTDDDVFANIG